MPGSPVKQVYLRGFSMTYCTSHGKTSGFAARFFCIRCALVALRTCTGQPLCGHTMEAFSTTYGHLKAKTYGLAVRFKYLSP